MFSRKQFAILTAFVTAAVAQQVGTQVAETHPPITWQRCTRSGGCTTVNGSIVLDANWRWLHTTSGYTNCYTGNAWDTSICSSPSACTSNCALDGAQYSSTYGITTSGNALTLKFKQGSNVGSRVYLMASDTRYEMFSLKNREFTFDVDVSRLGCGLNGAVYFVEMDADGGMARYPTNRAGAKYGTGYCDAQCPHDLKFINGEANILDWTASSTDANAGSGRYGSCCNEMDIWEANSISNAFTPHGCSVSGAYRCQGLECGDGSNRYQSVCDKDGCDFNPYRMGDTNFYGPGKTVNTNQKFTVVTQFITHDGTDTGRLTEIRRIYVQNGVVINNTYSNIPGIPASNSITEQFCSVQKSVFNDYDKFTELDGYVPMDLAMQHGLVLVLSIWADHAAHMLWLDSTYPVDSTELGAARGTCPTTSGDPRDVESQQGDSTVTYSNIRWGELNSTYSGTTSSTTRPVSTSSTRPASTSTRSTSSTRPPSSTTRPTSSTRSSSTSSTRTSSAAGPGQTLWGQCGGMYHTGPTTCAQGRCVYQNPWYSQCLP